MDTAERQYVRELAYTMEATYQGNPEGLKATQGAAAEVVAAMRASFPNETDEARSCVARGVARVVAYLAQLPVMAVGSRMESIAAAYPMAAGALAGVYVLPDLKQDETDTTQAKPAPTPNTGQYL